MSSKHHFSEDNVALELGFIKLFRKLWPYLWAHKARVYYSLLWVGLFVLVGRALPFLFGLAIDDGIKLGHREVIVWVAIGYLVLETVRSLLSYKQSFHIQRFGNEVLFELRERLIRHTQALPVTYFEKNPSGRTVTRVTTDVFALGELFSEGFAAIFVNAIEMASIFVSLAVISWRMTFVATLVLPPLIWICTSLSKRIRVQFGAAKRKLSTINAYAAESMSGIKILQLFDRVYETRMSFLQLSSEYRDLQLSTVKLFATLWPVIEAFNVFSLAVALFLGAYFHSKGAMSVGQLSAYILLLQGFFKPLKTILERYNQLQNSLASADRVFQLLDEVEEKHSGSSLPTARLKGAIEIRNLNFRYSEASNYVLKDISLVIHPGQSVALIGRTGSGKSTMIALLQKLYEIREGDILIDGESLNSIAPQALRPRVGVVQQEGFVFSGSFLNNITLFNEQIPRARAEWAVEQAQCQDILKRHGGLDGPVLERGSNLSAGERQLLAFARVLAYDPDILILDEATANIDSVSEKQIQKATDVVTRGRTSVIIAHRLSTILHCDLIVVLDHGRIVEQGKHHELLAKRGKYFELYSLQFKDLPPTLNQVDRHH